MNDSCRKDLKNIFNSIFDSVFIFNYELNFLEVNNAFVTLLGYTREELLLGKVENVLMEEFQSQFLKIIKDKLSGKNIIHEVAFVGKTGEVFLVELTIHKIDFNNSDAFIVICRNLNVKKRLNASWFGLNKKKRDKYCQELNTGLGSIISTMKIYIHVVKNNQNSDKINEYYARLDELLDDGLRIIRSISKDISPDLLRSFGLVKALNVFIKKLESLSESQIVFSYNLQDRLPKVIEFVLYWVLIELLEKSIKYANANKITLNIHKKDQGVYVTFIDDGIGFDYENKKKLQEENELQNLKNRINEIGGLIDYYSEVGKGVHVKIFIKQ